MHDDFHQRSNQIRRMQGKDPIDGTKIEGFGPSDPPAPPPGAGVPEIPPASEAYGAPIEPSPTEALPAPVLPESPMVALGRKMVSQGSQGPAAAPRDEGPTQEVVLWVRDGQARFQGQQVTLEESDQTKIAEVILRAGKRAMDSKLEALIGAKPRKPRAPRGSGRKRSPSTTAVGRSSSKSTD